MSIKYSFLIPLFFIGIIFRYYLVRTFPQPFVFDQEQYLFYTNSIKAFGLYAHSFRLYGYPAFLFFVEKTLGNGTFMGLHPWQAVQILIDVLTAFLVLGTAKLLFKKFSIAVFSFVLYLFNPFTAGYTGVMLPEVLAAFLFALLYIQAAKILIIGPLFSGIIIGLLLGYIPQVRPAYYYFSWIMLLFIVIYIYKMFSKNRWLYISLLTVSFIIPFIYTVWGNYRWFSAYSLTDVDKLAIQNFYISMFIKNSTNIGLSIDKYPKEVHWAYAEYSYLRNTNEDRKNNQKLFFRLALDEIKRDPVKFIKWRISKMWYVFEKHSIFPYSSPQNNLSITAIYSANLMLILFFIQGFIYWAKKEITNNRINGKWLVFFIGCPIFYTMIANIFTSTEERYSLPVYPLIILFSGIGMYVVINLLKKRKV